MCAEDILCVLNGFLRRKLQRQEKYPGIYADSAFSVSGRKLWQVVIRVHKMVSENI